MKIAFLNVTAGGSTGKIMTATAEAAAAAGHECVVFYGRGEAKQSENVKFIKMEGTASVLVHGAYARFLGRNGHGSKSATLKIVKYLENFKPDVIQLHNIHGYYINIKILFDYLKKSGAKIYWTLHDCWAFTGGCAHFTAAGCEKWKSHCGKCEFRNVYPKSYPDRTKNEFDFKKKIFSGVENLTLITPCEWLKNLTRESFLSDYPCVCIPNGIDVIKFKNGTQKVPFELPEKYILGVASVWDSRKRPEIFAKTVELLKDDGFKGIMIGKTDKKFINSLDSSNSGIITVIERTENIGLLASLYKNAVCCVSTSVEDTFPTIGLESMACGTPVVYADVCGCPEQVKGDLPSGETAKPDNPEDFAKAVKKISENRNFYAENCAKKVAEHFTLEKMKNSYVNIYER